MAVSGAATAVMQMKHVLIVDDDYDICESLQLALEERYRVSTAHNGLQALRVLESDATVDAVVLDLMMPVLDGESTMQEMRARGWSVPVIIASAATQLALRAQSSGAAAWIQKPFDVNDLEDALARALRDGESDGSHAPQRPESVQESEPVRPFRPRNPPRAARE
ncbi:MAG TPA: response regulator [Myxococcaceae bacterium]|nr:response regulator [Myxococcaceae bacterium]